MNICEKENLGNFNSCYEIDLELDEEITLTNLTTNHRCVYEDGNFGILAPGTYIAIAESGTYQFKVT